MDPIIIPVNSLWKHYLLREFIINSLSVSQIGFTVDLFPYHEFTMLLLSFSQRQFQLAICYEKSFWIRFLFRELSINSLFFIADF